MPRKARVKSQSGVYHVMLRGNNHQLIFIDKEDNNQFLALLDRFRKECGISLYAWCLMPNHIHLLIKEKDVSLSDFFRKFTSGFVYWYNRKYDRIGHLFQDRFNSEPVENELYFLKAARYIHMNPVKAHICNHPGDFVFSSYAYYFNGTHYKKSDFVFGLMDIASFEKFHFEINDDRFLDIDEDEVTSISDDAVFVLLQSQYGFSDFSLVPRVKQEMAIDLLLQSGASVNQIRRLTNIDRSVIQSVAARK